MKALYFFSKHCTYTKELPSTKKKNNCNVYVWIYQRKKKITSVNSFIFLRWRIGKIKVHFWETILKKICIVKIVLSLSCFKRYFNFIVRKKRWHFTLCSLVKQVQCCCLHRKDTRCNKSSVCSREKDELHWSWLGFPGCSAQYFILATLRLVQVFIISCALC